MTAPHQIPKIIHYCWFGQTPLPEKAQCCIASWKKFCPGYEIMEWNEHQLDLLSAPSYVQQAYAAQKWAFVADYVRLCALIKYGGVYMDTDVELLHPLAPFMSQEAFAGFEDTSHGVRTGVSSFQGIPVPLQQYAIFETGRHIEHHHECGSSNRDLS